ncbi:MAG: hypothetical protein PVSMB7_07280 [Chloroflexota bacterium]
MRIPFPVWRVWTLCAALLLSLCCFLPLSHAQTGGGVHTVVVRFTGQVASVQVSRDGTPLAFTLRIARRLVDFRTSPQAKLVPRSAEAAVEGFMPNDYATVMARRVNRQWVAQRVEFDVQSIPASPLPIVTVMGTVVAESATNRSLTMTLDTGDVRLVLITKQTRFRIDGQIVSPTPLMKGDTVRVTMRRAGRSWVAVEINLQTAPLRLRV